MLDPEIKNPAIETGLKCVKVISSFGDFGGLQSLGAALDFELHALAFVKSAKAFALNGFEVYKHVIARFTLDEAVTLSFIEPFDCAGFHVLDRLSFCKVEQAAEPKLARVEVGGTTSFCNYCSHTDQERERPCKHARGTLVEHNNFAA